VDPSEYPHIFELIHNSFLSVSSSNTNEATRLMDSSSVYYTYYYYLGILFNDINDGSNLCNKHTFCLLYTDFNQFWCFHYKMEALCWTF